MGGVHRTLFEGSRPPVFAGFWDVCPELRVSAEFPPLLGVVRQDTTGGTHDKIQIDWRCGGPVVFAGSARDGPPPTYSLPASAPRREHLLRDQRTGKPPQQILRLHAVVAMAASQLGQLAR
jgi:hypothetical protein